MTPGELETPELTSLAKLMSDVSLPPSSRLTAVKALQHAYFDTIFSRERGAVCTMCLSPFSVDAGVECPKLDGAHFVCTGCFERYVNDGLESMSQLNAHGGSVRNIVVARYVLNELDNVTANEAKLEEHRAQGGRVRCPMGAVGVCTHFFTDQVAR